MRKRVQSRRSRRNRRSKRRSTIRRKHRGGVDTVYNITVPISYHLDEDPTLTNDDITTLIRKHIEEELEYPEDLCLLAYDMLDVQYITDAKFTDTAIKFTYTDVPHRIESAEQLKYDIQMSDPRRSRSGLWRIPVNPANIYGNHGIRGTITVHSPGVIVEVVPPV